MNAHGRAVTTMRLQARSRLPWLWVLSGLWLILPALAPTPGAAQVHEHAPPTGREIQVPVDAAFLEITPQVRRQLGLFPEVEGFASARLFLLEGGGYVLEISSTRDGRIERTRTPMTEYDLRLLREDIESRLDVRGTSIVANREGRGGLVLRQTVLGLGFYGWAVPEVLGVSGDRAQVAAYLLTAGASFYLPYRMTRGRSVSGAHRNFVLWGGTRGIVHGALLGDLITGPELESGEQSFDGRDGDDRIRLGSAMVGSIAGSLFAFRAVDRVEVADDPFRLWCAMGDYGILAGLGTAYILGLYDEEQGRVVPDPALCPPVEPVCPYLLSEGGRTPRLRLGHAVTLGASAAGLYGGMKLGERERYTEGNVTALSSMGILGAQALLPVTYGIDDEGEKLMVAGALAGSAAGLFVGNRLLREQAFSESDGLLLAAGHVVGGLTAMGVTYLIAGDDGRALLYLTTSALGSGLGFGFTYRALDHRRGDAWRGGDARGAGGEAGGGMRGGSAHGLSAPRGGPGSRGATGRGILPGRSAAVTLTPSALLVPFLPGIRSGGRGAEDREAVRLPVFSLRF